MPEKITYEELLRRMHDPAIPEADLRPYLMAAPEGNPLDRSWCPTRRRSS
ncbi:MAG: peptide-methionine (S)-S-oxide reductase [Mesorhizobium sp.]|nr:MULTISPECIES: peptide-methionine (S)-S-oxide reductase [unclassified Mesorhizobium]TIX55446.1 MAG: peptide-methionine (S)-S-oxide reductase [Mesorhizobium sp.]